MMEDWQKLNGPEKEAFVSAVTPLLAPQSVAAENLSVRYHRLEFYEDYGLYEISDHTLSPALLKYALYKPDHEAQLLDWTNGPIYTVNQVAPIQLNDFTVVDYIKFFFSHVRGRHGRFLVVEHVDEISWQIDPPPEGRKALQDLLTPVLPQSKDEDGTYHLQCFMIFKDSLFKTKAHVKPNGMVSLSEEELKIEGLPVIEDKTGLA